jgi:hypothetical protein
LGDERGTCHRRCDDQPTPTHDIADTPHSSPPSRGARSSHREPS